MQVKKFLLLSMLGMLIIPSYGQSRQNLEQALNNPGRPASDKERDVNRRAPEILEFMGVREGDTALDIIAMGGWYSEVLSHAVGNSGKVIMHNNPIPITENSTDERAERMSRLSNVEDYIGAVSEIPLGTVDFAITALNFHDVHNRSVDDADAMLKGILGALKPGGVLAIIDHEGTEGADNPALHRIAFEDAVKTSLNSGFVLVGASNLLENTADDHTLSPFDPSLERRTDRLVLKLVKPD